MFDLATGDEIPSSEVVFNNESPDLITLRENSNGDITLLGLGKEGTAYISASWNGYTTRSRIELIDLENSISLANISWYVSPGDSPRVTLYDYSVSRFGNDYTVDWTADDPSVVRLEPTTTADGEYAVIAHCLDYGVAVITCTVTWSDGTVRQNYCTIGVIYDD